MESFLDDFFAGAADGEVHLRPGDYRLRREFPDAASRDTMLTRARPLLPPGTRWITEFSLPPAPPARENPDPAPPDSTPASPSPEPAPDAP